MSEDITDRSDDGRKNSRGLFGLFGRRNRDQGLRESIATLVHEAAQPFEETGDEPELDRQERALIMNVLRLRDITADDVMIPAQISLPCQRASPSTMPWITCVGKTIPVCRSIAASSTISRA